MLRYDSERVRLGRLVFWVWVSFAIVACGKDEPTNGAGGGSGTSGKGGAGPVCDPSLCPKPEAGAACCVTADGPCGAEIGGSCKVLSPGSGGTSGAGGTSGGAPDAAPDSPEVGGDSAPDVALDVRPE